MIKDLIRILAIVNVNLMNYVMLENIQIIKKCNCSKRLVDKLVEECSDNTYEKELHPNKMTYNSTLNDYEKLCSSCTIHIVLFVIFFLKICKH